MKRREFNSALWAACGLSAVAGGAAAASSPRTSARYVASVGARLYTFEVEPKSKRLTQRHGPVSTPEQVHFGCQHPIRSVLYIASSDEFTGKLKRHFLSAYLIDATGALRPFGTPTPLPQRPVHITVDRSGKYLITAHNRPSSVSVHRLERNGALGELAPQEPGLDTGVYAHQVRVLPSNRAVLVVARGNNASAQGPEDPGSLRVFSFADGLLRNPRTVAPRGGLGYRPRHADFHPSGKWAYVNLESQNQVHTYGIEQDRLSAAPLFVASTLENSGEAKRGQLASAIQVHPTGRALYVANRGTGTEDYNGVRVSNGGENTIAVFVIDQATGKPTQVQTVDVRGIHPRTLDLSDDGKWMVAGTIQPALVRVGDRVETVSAGLSLFSVARDGRLIFESKFDIDGQSDQVFWVGALR